MKQRKGKIKSWKQKSKGSAEMAERTKPLK